MARIAEQYPEVTEQRRLEFRREYEAAMRDVQRAPERFESVDIILLDELRTKAQLRYGFDDPYKDVKNHANDVALETLPNILAELDGFAPEAEAEQIARGLLAGNMFDVGATAAVERYHEFDSDFARLRDSLPERPWLRDDLDGWIERWNGGAAYEHAAFFVDNAGADICLGCLPLARWMIRRGARVSLVANSSPALNDVTAEELAAIVLRAGDADAAISQAFASSALSIVKSGGWSPLIDLTGLLPDCVRAIQGADLIVLHGMGRAIESNLSAHFTCDVLRTAVLKDRAVARWIGGDLFDCVFSLTPAQRAGV